MDREAQEAGKARIVPNLLRTAGAPGKQVPRNGRLEGMAKSVPGCFKGGEPSVRPKRRAGESVRLTHELQRLGDFDPGGS